MPPCQRRSTRGVRHRGVDGGHVRQALLFVVTGAEGSGDEETYCVGSAELFCGGTTSVHTLIYWPFLDAEGGVGEAPQPSPTILCSRLALPPPLNHSSSTGTAMATSCAR